jgi:hypothetical protein
LLSFGCVCVCISLFCMHCVFIWLCISPWNLGHHIVCLCVCLCLRLGMCGCVYMFVYLCLSMYVSCGFVNVWIVCVCMCTIFSCSNNEQKLCSMSKRFYWHVCASSYYNFTVCKPCTYISYFHFVNLLLLQSWKDFFLRNPLWKSWHFYFVFVFFLCVTKRLWTPTFAILW